jgi:hypothetical protein
MKNDAAFRLAELKRRQGPPLTPEQIAARKIVAGARLVQMFTDIDEHRCVLCGQEGVTLEQIYGCVYTRECGHRQYNGRLP